MSWPSPWRRGGSAVDSPGTRDCFGVGATTSETNRKARGDGRVNNKGRGLKRLEVVHLTTFAEAGWGAMETSYYKRPCAPWWSATGDLQVSTADQPRAPHGGQPVGQPRAAAKSSRLPGGSQDGSH